MSHKLRNSKRSMARNLGRILPFCFLALIQSACSPKDVGFLANKKVIQSSKDDKSKGDADGEKVDIPSNISGSYLICALRKEALDTDPSSEYGCRLNEAGTDRKLELGSQIAQVQWSSNVLENVRIDIKPAEAIYHATYTLSGTSRASVQELSAKLEVLVQWQTAAGTAPLLFKDQHILEVLKPAASIGDTSAPILQGQGIDPTDPGTLLK